MLSEIRWLGQERICQFHLKDNPHYLGEGPIDFAKVLEAIRDIGFAGYANLETDPPSGSVEKDLQQQSGVRARADEPHLTRTESSGRCCELIRRGRYVMENEVTRRGFLGGTTLLTAATAFTIVKPQLVRGSGKERIRAGLIGCGSRGTQAALDNFAGCDNVELTAMGDAFQDRLERSVARLQQSPFSSRVKVDPEHQFVGLDAYRKVIASDVDLIMLATPPGYRPIHFEAAVDARKHMFCEKPFGTDAVAVRRFMAAAKKSEDLKLSVKSGAQRRSQAWYLEQFQRVTAARSARSRLAMPSGRALLSCNSWKDGPVRRAGATRSGATSNSRCVTGTHSRGSAATR